MRAAWRADGIEGRGLDCEPQAGGEAHGAQQAQVVFAEAGVGIADGADQAGVEIGAAPDVIQHLARFRDPSCRPLMVKSRRITSGLRIGLEVHATGRRPSLVFVVAAEGGDFHLGEGVAHQHHAEMRAHQAGSREQVS
jgi:hypothetical protein